VSKVHDDACNKQHKLMRSISTRQRAAHFVRWATEIVRKHVYHDVEEYVL